MSLEHLVQDAILPTGRRCFPVMEGDRVLGLVTVHRIKEIPREQWSFTTASQVMIPAHDMQKARPDEGLYEILERMTAEDVNQIPIMDDGHWMGMVARDNVLNFIRTRSELRK